MEQIKVSDKIKNPKAEKNKSTEKDKANDRVKDAKIVSEEPIDKNQKNVTDSGNESTETKGNDKNIKFSAEVDLNAKDEKQSTAKVNFVDNNFMSDFVKKKTTRSAESPGLNDDDKSENGKEKETAQSTPQASSEKPNTVDSFTEADFMDIADTFMGILDMGIASLLRFVAKDDTSTPYELDEKKKKRLTRQLGNLFIKYNKKFSLEFMFIVTLAICYSGPIGEARSRRKLIKENGGVVPPRSKGQPAKASR